MSSTVLPPGRGDETGLAGRRRRVVVATQGRDETWSAVRWAATFASGGGWQLAVVDVHSDDDPESTGDQMSARRAELAAQMHGRISAAGIHVDVVTCVAGDPTSEIRRAALQAVAVVLGAHRPGDHHRFGHGQLAHRLAVSAPCPLVVVPVGSASPARIVLGLDGTPNDVDVLAAANTYARAFSCPVTAVHVRDPLTGLFAAPGDAPVHDAALRCARIGDVEVIERVGENAAAEILDVARTRAAGLVVIGVPQSRRIPGRVPSEVARRLLAQDEVAVTIVPLGRSCEP
jgi:nucleotide-binding universal stress UspA family protein